MSLFAGSRYLRTPIYARKGQQYILDIRNKYNFNLEDAEYYTVVQGDTIDLIAYSMYGNANLYWAILDSNGLMSELDLEPGMILVIPPYEEVVRVSE